MINLFKFAPPLLGISCLTLGTGLPVWADQCAYISKQQSLNAVALLEKGQVIYQFCQLCGDKIPQPLTINALAAETVDAENYWQVSINGQGIDLVYSYIPLPQSNWKVNLATLVKCPTQQVTPLIGR